MMSSKRAVNTVDCPVTPEEDRENGIIALLRAVEVTGLTRHGPDNRPPDTFVVATIDGRETWKSDVVRKDINPQWVMSDPIKLFIRPSSDLKIDVFRKSRLKLKPHNSGTVSDKVVKLVDNKTRILQGNGNSLNTCIKIHLTIDKSHELSIDDLGIGTASQQLDRAQVSLARRGNDPRLFIAASGRIDQASSMVQAAESACATAQPLSGVQLVGDALKYLDVVVKFVDGVADVHPMFKVAWTVLSYIYKALKRQVEQDRAVWELSAGLHKMLSYAKACCDLKKIEGVPNVIEEAAHLVVEGALLIDECMKSGFIGRAVKSVFSDISNQIEQCRKNLDTLRTDLSLTLAIDNNQGIKAISTKDDELLKELKAKGMRIPEECMDETRRDVLATVHSWVDNLEAPNILWVNGFPGVGKSAIASTLVTELRASRRLGSSFFFMRDEPTFATPVALWCNVAYDLARLCPSVLKVVLEKLNEEVVGVNTPNVKMLFRHLIEEPVTSNTDIASDRPLVVVVDALDECGGLDGQRSRHRESLLDTIKSWSRLPSRFKLVITSRREDDILTALSAIGHESIPLLSGESVQTQSSSDIRLFLTDRFAHIAAAYPESLGSAWPGRMVIDELTGRAAGLFVWATTVAEFIKQGVPKKQLQQIQQGDVGYGNMTALYSRILNISFNKPSPEFLNSFHIVAGAIILAKTPLRRADYLALLPVEANDFDFICKGLQSVMIVGNTLRFNHQSFVDFMTDPDNCPPAFLIDLGEQNGKLALACLLAMNGLHFNMCELETSHIRNDDVPRLGERVKEAIPGHLDYSCRFWMDHLRATAFSPSTLIKVNEFMRTRFLYWLEALSLMRDVNIGTQVLRSIVEWCGTHNNDTLAFVKAAIKFVTAFGSVIAQSVPHLYLSALPFAPKTSEICKVFLADFPQTLSVATGKATAWPSIQHILEGHCNVVRSVAFSPDGTRIVSGSDDDTIRVWDAETGDVVSGPFKGHSGDVNSVAFSPDGKCIVSGSDDNTIRVWDAETGDVVSGPFQGHSNSVTSVAFSPDGTRIASGSDDNTIRLWDAETGDIVSGPFQGHSDKVNSVAFSPDGRRIVSGSYDSTIRIWDAETGDVVSGPFQGHSNRVTSVAFSPDGSRIVSGSWDDTIRVWDAETGDVVSGPFQGHSNWVTSVAFSPDGKCIVSGSWDNTIRIWDAKRGDIVSGPFQGHSKWVNSVAFSPDGKRIVSGSGDNKIRVWDAETGDIVSGSFQGHSRRVSSVAFSPDGTRIVSGSYDKTIRVWDAETGDVVSGPFQGHSDEVNCVAFSADGTRIASGSDDSTIRVWDAETRDVVSGPFQGHSNRVTSVAFSPDGTRIVSGSWDNTIRVWDAETGDVVSGPFQGHSGTVTSVAFSPDGMHIVSGSWDNTIRVWDAETGDVVSGPFQGHSNWVTSVAFSPDGKCIVSGSWDNTIQVWDAETGDVVSGPFQGHSGSVTSVAFSPDGMRIVSGSCDNTIRVWDPETGDVVSGPIQGHSDWVTSVAFSPDGTRIVSGSCDNTIRVWDAKARDVVSEPFLGCSSRTFSPDGTRIVSGANARGGKAFQPCSPFAQEKTLPEFRDESRMDKGWVLSVQPELLLFWVPAWNRCLYRPGNTVVIGEAATKLDLSRFVHGTSWQQCRAQINASDGT